MFDEYEVLVIAIPKSQVQELRDKLGNKLYWVQTVSREDDADSLAECSANILTGINSLVGLSKA
jgi:hypothetical protein